jgi:ribosome recycling factor
VRGTNLLVVNPFDESMKDSINKGIESSKLDLQVVTEGSSLIVTIGNIPNEMKKELKIKVDKLYNAVKEVIKENRHSLLSETKKLEKIIGKDDARRLEKLTLETIDK